MITVGIAGKARSGKDSLAKLAFPDWFHLAFANPIKEMEEIVLEGIENIPEDKEEIIPELGVSRRHIQQTLGTDWGREMIHPDIWVMCAMREAQDVELMHPDLPGIIFTDVRLDNEADWIRSRGGWIIHINRPDAPEVRKHSSELGVRHDATDLIVENNGSLDDLKKVGEHIRDAIMQYHLNKGDSNV
jgi:hypothetical protein